MKRADREVVKFPVLGLRVYFADAAGHQSTSVFPLIKVFLALQFQLPIARFQVLLRCMLLALFLFSLPTLLVQSAT